MIVGLLSLVAFNANAKGFLEEAGGAVVQTLTPPNTTVRVDPKKPLTPLSIEVEKGPLKGKVTPGPVPASPAVEAKGNGFVANLINKGNEIAQAPKNFIDQKGREINKGFIHLGNEIGMLWANFKNDLKKKGEALFKSALDWAKEYVVWAIVALAAILVMPAVLSAMLTAWLVRRGKRSRSRRRLNPHHA
jgi:hypothetical protein